MVRDIDGTDILIGDRVTSLTRGLFLSESGIVYKVSSNGWRVTNRDNNCHSISRGPHNLRIQL